MQILLCGDSHESFARIGEQLLAVPRSVTKYYDSKVSSLIRGDCKRLSLLDPRKLS